MRRQFKSCRGIQSHSVPSHPSLHHAIPHICCIHVYVYIHICIWRERERDRERERCVYTYQFICFVYAILHIILTATISLAAHTTIIITLQLLLPLALPLSTVVDGYCYPCRCRQCRCCQRRVYRNRHPQHQRLHWRQQQRQCQHQCQPDVFPAMWRWLFPGRHNGATRTLQRSVGAPCGCQARTSRRRQVCQVRRCFCRLCLLHLPRPSMARFHSRRFGAPGCPKSEVHGVGAILCMKASHKMPKRCSEGT